MSFLDINQSRRVHFKTTKLHTTYRLFSRFELFAKEFWRHIRLDRNILKTGCRSTITDSSFITLFKTGHLSEQKRAYIYNLHVKMLWDFFEILYVKNVNDIKYYNLAPHKRCKWFAPWQNWEFCVRFDSFKFEPLCSIPTWSYLGFSQYSRGCMFTQNIFLKKYWFETSI